MHVHIENLKDDDVALKKDPSQDEVAALPQESGFPVPFTLEDFQQDVLTLFFFQIRTIGWMTDAETAWRITGKTKIPEYDFFDPEQDAKEIGLSYDDIRHTCFAKCLERLYLFGYHGILDESVEPFEDDGIYTWMSTILCDLAQSHILQEWDAYGALCQDSAQRALRVAELANARCIMEKGKHLYYFQTGGEITTYDALTIRQMALLSGMEEMSIRAAANPNRANPLVTFKEDNHTRIALDVAKNWLKLKGRYVAVTRQWTKEHIDLTTRRFMHFNDLFSVIDQRLVDFKHDDSRAGDAWEEYEALFAKHHFKVGDDKSHFLKLDYVRDLAVVLDFPVDLFCLRVRELVVKKEAEEIKKALGKLTQQPIE